MQKIMFDHRRFGLEQAVLERLKTMTRRGAKLPDGLEAKDVWNPVMGIDERGRVYFTVDCIDAKQRDLYPQYQLGEVVAVAQSYINVYKGRTVNGSFYDWCKLRDLDPHREIEKMEALKKEQGWDNKMYVRADMMPHRIKITNIKLERMQDISDEDCRKEGIVPVTWRQYPEPFGDRYVDHDLWTLPKFRESVNDSWGEQDPDEFLAKSPQVAFYVVIRKLMGKKTWDANPWVWVYEFELKKPHRGTVPV